MSRTGYAISWLYGEFRIARLQRGEVQEEWQAPTLINTHTALVEALDAAADCIDLSAKGDVTIVHEHDLHTHEYLELPTMRRRDLEKFLLRKVEQSKKFADKAAWCYHEVHHQNGKKGILLHQLPKNIVDSTISACAAVGLAPKRYVPLTEIVSAYLPEKDFSKDQMVVVVCCFTERVELIVALGDGEALFVRELNYGASKETVERLVTDVNRTVRYTRQQLGRMVDTAWVMGQPEWQVVNGLRDGVQVAVEFDEQASDPNFWARQGAKLSGRLSANFITTLAQNNITVEVLRRVGVYATAALVVIAVALSLAVSGLVAHRNEQIRSVQASSEEVAAQIAKLEELVNLSVTQKDHLQRLQASTHNLPSLFLLHLSRLAPPEVVLTEVSVDQAQSGWTVKLQGTVAGDLRHSARVLAQFEQDLSTAPWQIDVTGSFRETWMEQFNQGKTSADPRLGFTIAGLMP